MKIFSLSLLPLALLALMWSACGDSKAPPQSADVEPIFTPKKDVDPMDNKGIGPVTELVLADLDPAMAAEGKEIYDAMCTACHKVEEKFIGPAPKGIMDRRSPEWIMNMILNPEEMVQKDPVAKKLLAEYNFAPMANQNLTQDQARKVLEYFRTIN